jgi:hypothetical protein
MMSKTARNAKMLLQGSCFLLFAADAIAADAVWSPAIDAACPEAVKERAERRAARPVPTDVSTFSRPALRTQLLQMQQQDQDARELFAAAFAEGDVPMDHPASVHVGEVDDLNLQKLKHIIAQDGFPTIAMVGVDGVHAAFLLTQHADVDPNFQKKMLRVLTNRFRAGEIPGGQFAMLTDRVLIAEGKPQRFGTQFHGEGEDLKPFPIADEVHVEERRQALGVISLANYACVVHAGSDTKPTAKP